MSRLLKSIDEIEIIDRLEIIVEFSNKKYRKIAKEGYRRKIVEERL
jgi:hypothetical protein